MLHHRIVVDAALRFADQPVADVEPRARIVAVFLRQPHGVLHVSRADVVRGEDEFDPLLFVRDGVLPDVIELPEVAARRFDALPRIGGIAAQLARGARHDLHQSHRAGPRARIRIETRFLKGLRGDEAPVPARDLRVFAEPVVVRRERAGFRGEIRTVRARGVGAAIEKIFSVEDGQQSRRALRREPPVERVAQLRRVEAHGPHDRLRRTDDRLDDEVRVLAALELRHVFRRHSERDLTLGEFLNQAVARFVHLDDVDVVAQFFVELEQALAIWRGARDLHLLPGELARRGDDAGPDGDRRRRGCFAREIFGDGRRRGAAGGRSLHDDRRGFVQRLRDGHAGGRRGGRQRELRRDEVAVAAIEAVEQFAAVAHDDRLELQLRVAREHRQQLVFVAERFTAIEKVAGGVEGEEDAQHAVQLRQIARDRLGCRRLHRRRFDRLRKLRRRRRAARDARRGTLLVRAARDEQNQRGDPECGGHAAATFQNRGHAAIATTSLPRTPAAIRP